MKAPTRYVLGVLSCLLLAVGFTDAADQLDPMTHSSFPKGLAHRLLKCNAGCDPCLSCYPCSLPVQARGY